MSGVTTATSLADCRVLIAEDEPAMRDVIARTLRRWGATVVDVASAAEALAELEAGGFDLVISDVNMPGRSGIELVRDVRQRWPELGVLMVTGAVDPDTPVEALHGGVDRFLWKPFTLASLREEVEQALEAREARRCASAMVKKLVGELREREREARTLILRGVRALIAAVEAKHPYTRGHSERVSRYATILAREHGGLDLDRIALGGELHDIGKIGIPDHILNKPGRLTEEELRQIAAHPTIGRRILEPLIDDEDILAMVLHHHERWDGRGYPGGLIGPEIPRVAQIIAVADTFDALTSSRAYRPGRTAGEAADEIRSERGRQFSDEMVDLFEGAFRRLESVCEAWRHREQMSPADEKTKNI